MSMDPLNSDGEVYRIQDLLIFVVSFVHFFQIVVDGVKRLLDRILELCKGDRSNVWICEPRESALISHP